MTPTQEDVVRSLRWRLAVTEELLKRSEKARIAAEERAAIEARGGKIIFNEEQN